MKRLVPFILILLLIILGLGFLVFKTSRTKVEQKVVSQPIVSYPPEKCIEHEIEFAKYAGDDPLWQKNNKFGLYIYAENKDFFNIADELVNSKGGDWGYVLIPFNVKDNDYSKWNTAFEKMRSKHLIPIIQLWDIDTKKYEEQTDKAAEFLDSFLWPIKFRYISVYNEPNDANFWRGKVDPENYARVLNYTIDSFKDRNSDFYILNGAFNTSASNTNSTMDAFLYMKEMNEELPGIFDRLDGWASHSYPQPNFAGNPYDRGRWSIRAYESELDYLKDVLGVKKDLPVFITETGWAHAEGENYNFLYLPDDIVSINIKAAFEDIWLKDDRVRAVTPFTVWYDPPHDHFSWVNQDKVPYKHYDEIKKMQKIKGEPPELKMEKLKVKSCD